MNSQNSTPETLLDSWMSAFLDGEASLIEPGMCWTETVHEQLYYYTLTRQVVRGDFVAQSREDHFHNQKIQCMRLWARVDAS